ncbi:hypothetical protein SOD_c31730 [Serratia plymuthica 4Rx13]|uniref:Uncharacterized protein n=1 Tax=Serratia plymuthica TaxID=82996 RepID=A0A318P764_SERPL|nr:hypothetical protein [Serratia plymuthica]AGO56140.1 hypothetical protein SOD_c31730 [Serratia plymuthica 4Rx13]PYD40928.1 hypothetical protein CT690_06550 [Serratia plymuthica]
MNEIILHLDPETESVRLTDIDNTKVIVSQDSDLSISKAYIKIGAGFNMLTWSGNAIASGSNSVSGNFRAVGSAEYGSGNTSILSANFITKDIYITTGAGGSQSASITTNASNFEFFNYIDLAGYTGSGRIFVDGQQEATEGEHAFDFGVMQSNAIIYNTAYSNVSNITQPSTTLTTPTGFALTGYADNVHLYNANRYLGAGDYLPTSVRVFNDATAASKVHVELATFRGANTVTDLNIDIGREFNPYTDAVPTQYNTQAINAGTFALTSHYTNRPVKETLKISSSFTNAELTLSGGNNHVTDISLNGFALGGQNNYVLKLNIKSDFSDSLTHIYIDELNNPNGNIAPVSVDIHSEQGGTGGGDFYSTLGTLQNSGQFSGIISALAGKQLFIEGQSQDDSFSVVGNTTIAGHGSGYQGDTFSFTQSTIAGSVKITDYNASVDRINAGTDGQQWTFSSAGDKSLVSYGDYGSSANLNALFSTLGGATDAQSLFTAALSKATGSASESSLAEVGAIKLGNSLYVIIDNNGNHSFDSQDIVFSLGNRDLSQTLSDLHYTAPQIELSGSTPTALLDTVA